MKKIIGTLTLAAAFAFAGHSASAQTHVIKANLFSPLVRTGSVFYEHALNENSSAQLGFFYTGFSISDVKLRGYGLTPEYRYYLSDGKVAPRGFYIGPYARYRNFNLSTEYTEQYTNTAGNIETIEVDAKATLSSIGGGLVIGHQFILKDRISIDIFAGPEYNSTNVKVKNNANQEKFDIGTFDGFGFRSGLTLGVAF